jgi:hypothetical protein
VPASVSTLPSVHIQILHNTNVVVIEVDVLNSTASVHISADRSGLNSEAVVAVSINSASPNDPSTSILMTANQVPNTTLSVFGLISMIFPATAPVGNNSYLFDATGINATFAQYLNQSSFFNDGYNVLFATFNLTMTYDGLPAGVKPSELVLVNLVSREVVKSSKVDSSKHSVTAGGLIGNPGVWGGGGIYTIGYETSTSNKTSVGSPISRVNPLNLIFTAGLMVMGPLIL